jgi:hypothetical protein
MSNFPWLMVAAIFLIVLAVAGCETPCDEFKPGDIVKHKTLDSEYLVIDVSFKYMTVRLSDGRAQDLTCVEVRKVRST